MRPDLFALALVLVTPAVDAEPRFEPVPVPEHIYSGGWEHFVGGGVAAFDCDGDALPELYAAGGASSAMLLRNRTTPGRPPRFEPDTPPALSLTGVTGAYALDVDSDGYMDLAVLRVGKNRLLRGGPDCTFSTAAEWRFSSGDRWTTGFSATWEAGRRLPTLAFGNYVDRTNPAGPFRACDANMLYRPKNGKYGPPVALEPGHCALSVLFSDWGRTGRADLRVSNDRHYYVDDGQEQMWAMQDPPRLYQAADGWQTHRLWGMGIASRDLDGDGRPEVLLSSMGDQRLQRLAPGADGPHFRDMPYDTGTSAHRPYAGGDGRPSTGWHTAFGDVQNDGRDDIFIAKGNVEQMPDSAMADPNNLLIQQADGRFAERGESAGIASMVRSRGAALVDLNADGLLDLVVVNRRAPLELYRNATERAGHWLSLGLHQPGPNRNAIGAWIEILANGRIVARERTIGGGHAGGASGPEHFGLGTALTIRLRVIWPDGVMSDWVDTPTNRALLVTRDGTGLSLTPY